MRMMSFFLTTSQFRARTKTVTRRLGWRNAKVGDIVMAVVKGQGIPKGGHVERLGRIRFTEVRREPVETIHLRPGDVAREGFPDLRPTEFVTFFCKANRCEPTKTITRIAYEYLDAEQAT